MLEKTSSIDIFQPYDPDNPTPLQFEYTITVKNDPLDRGCYRSSGYTIEDPLPEYLKFVSLVSAKNEQNLDLDEEVSCVDSNGEVVGISPADCSYPNVLQVKIQNSLPYVTVPNPRYPKYSDEPYIEPPINAVLDDISPNLCETQYHEVTFLVEYVPVGYAPLQLENSACVNGFQYDPWGGAVDFYNEATGTIDVIPASGNNCDDDNVITEVDLVSFSAHPEGSAIQVDWETATERDNLGFNLYRATSPDGERTKLNAALIPSFSPGGNLGGTYAYTDIFDLQPGTVYYYWLEDMDMSGKLTLHGPISTRSPAMLLLNRIYLPAILGGD